MAFAPRKAFPCAAAKEPNPSGALRQCLASGADTSLFVIPTVVEESRSRKAADKGERVRFLRFTHFVRFGRNDRAAVEAMLLNPSGALRQLPLKRAPLFGKL